MRHVTLVNSVFPRKLNLVRYKPSVTSNSCISGLRFSAIEPSTISSPKVIMLSYINALFALILLCSKVDDIDGAAVKSRGLGPAKPCSPNICKLPDCRCSGVDIPGNLPRDKVPQMVMLSFDDAVNGQVNGFYDTLFDGELKNPNGCNATATFFVSHEYTEYQMVQKLYHKRHDIADHTISHRTPTSWWKSANYSQLTDEIAGQKEILRKWGQVKAEDIVGFRVPFLQIGGNTMYQVLYDNKFLYDSSMPTQKFMDPPMWPYTLDYQSTQECVIPPCPTGELAESTKLSRGGREGPSIHSPY